MADRWRVTASQFDGSAGCARRLRRALDPDVRGQSFPRNERRFLLNSLVRSTVVDAHRLVDDEVGSLEDALDSTMAAAEGSALLGRLLPEERAVYDAAVATYGELAAGREGSLRGQSPAPRPSRTGRFELAVNAELLFDLPGGGIELRRLRLGARRPFHPAVAATGYAKVAALVIQATPFLRVADFHLAGGDDVHAAEIPSEALPALGAEVTATVLAAMDAAEPEAGPGWGCPTCPYLWGCPAVTQSSVDEVLAGGS